MLRLCTYQCVVCSLKPHSTQTVRGCVLSGEVSGGGGGCLAYVLGGRGSYVNIITLLCIMVIADADWRVIL